MAVTTDDLAVMIQNLEMTLVDTNTKVGSIKGSVEGLVSDFSAFEQLNQVTQADILNAVQNSGGAGGVAVIPRQVVVTTNGTWQRPADMVGNRVRLTGIGGGASGNVANITERARGGQAGQWVMGYEVDIGSDEDVNVTIGQGGAAPTSTPSNGNSGTDTQFGSYLTLDGGAAPYTAGYQVANHTGAQGVAGIQTYGQATPLSNGPATSNFQNIGVPGSGLVIGGNAPVSGGMQQPKGTSAVGYGAGGYGGDSTSGGTGATAGLDGVLVIEYWAAVALPSS